MYEQLFKYFGKYSSTPLTEADTALIREVFVPKKLRKKQFLLQEGEVCKYLAFIVKGAMRQYTVDDKGFEHTIKLSIENWWVGDRESFTLLTPSIYNIEAWEDTELLTSTKADSTKLFHIPAAIETFKRVDENHAIAMQKRVNASITMTAEQRYAELVNLYPQFLQRFPQHIIASYLGVTKETLSRVRHKALSK
jgi:CRP-like cAMP-binding protein